MTLTSFNNKVEEVLFVDSEYNTPEYKDNVYISDDALAREYKKLFEFNNIIFYHHKLHPKTSGVKGVTKYVDNGESKNLVVMSLFFHENTILNIKSDKLLQVDLVTIHHDFKNLGLVSKVYFYLAKLGYLVSSDFSQYRGGKSLWMKIVKTSSSNKCKVQVWDNSFNKYLQDQNGKVIIYDGKSLDEDDIWTKDENDPIISNRVLVLSKR